AEPDRKLRVLVVDDNIESAELVAEGLSLRGHEVAVAHDGPSALLKAVEFRPEAALVDIGLPVMDGFALAPRLREVSGPIRLIALTGYSREDDRERTRAATFDGHLIKPVSLREIVASLVGAERDPR
ncbi:MAG TPA: response regulator, partial [Kofleriaceae bacterium]|nr:response regulator [Kofleriaceae bacterium]